MHRIDRQDLRDSFFVTIKTMRRGRHGSARHPLPDLKDDFLVSQLATALVDIVDGDSRMVLRTEEKPQSHGVRGKWGIDEPWPDGIEPR